MKPHDRTEWPPERERALFESIKADPEKGSKELGVEHGVSKRAIIAKCGRLWYGLSTIQDMLRANPDMEMPPREESDEVPAPEPDLAGLRRCLKCQKNFMSDGPGNRLCEPCKKEPVFSSAEW